MFRQSLLLVFLIAQLDASWLFARECDEELSGPFGVLDFTDLSTISSAWNFYCEYNVTTREGNTILANITSMSIHPAVAGCGDSYIQLKDGIHDSASILGNNKYCGNSSVGPLISTGHELNIRIAMEMGLRAQYTLMFQENPKTCGGIFKMSPNNVKHILESPSVTNSSSSSQCVWIFVAPIDYVLMIEPSFVSNCSTDICEYDYFEIRNGGTSASPRILETHSDFNEEIITTGNLLYVKHHWNMLHPSTTLHATVTAIKHACGGTLRAESGTIMSPNYPFHSQDNDCEWKIIVPRNKRIEFSFHDLHLFDSINCEQRSYVKISERIVENGSNKALGTYCGFHKPHVVKTSCNRAVVKYHDDYRSIGHFRGFVLNYTVTDEPCVTSCGGVLTSEQGIISSPNFSDDYPPNQHCEWNVTVPANKRIRLQFFRVIIDESTGCTEDYLEIFQVLNGHLESLGRFCGNVNPAVIVTTSSEVKVVFNSNGRGEDSGFLLTYSTVEEPSNVIDSCDQEFRESSGVITSLNYPRPFPPLKTCIYKIIRPPGNIIMLKITNWFVEDQNRLTHCRIYIYYSDNNLGKYGGSFGVNSTQPYVFNSTTNFLTLSFVSLTSSQVCLGFNAIYETFDKKCGGLFRDPKGIIKSPNYPNSYRNREDCLWIIEAPVDHVILITWNAFRTERYLDNVVIKDHGIIIGRYNGTDLPSSLLSRSDSLTITFTTDGSVVNSGFSANYAFINTDQTKDIKYSF